MERLREEAAKSMGKSKEDLTDMEASFCGAHKARPSILAVEYRYRYIALDVEVDVGIDSYFGRLKGVSKPVQVLLNCIGAVRY